MLDTLNADIKTLGNPKKVPQVPTVLLVGPVAKQNVRVRRTTKTFLVKIARITSSRQKKVFRS